MHALILSVGPLAAVFVAGSPGPLLALVVVTGDEKRESLEEFLARARVQREQVHSRLRQQVNAVVQRIDGLSLPAPKEVRDQLADELVDLGSEAGPLLVPLIDPGSSAIEKDRFRASQVTAALARMDSTPLTSALLAMLHNGTLEGKKNAVRVLEGSTDAARVRPALIEAFKKSEGTLRQSILRALIRLGGGSDTSLFDEVMAGSDSASIDMALAAATETKSEAIAGHVRKLLADPHRAPAHADALLAYFRALPELVEENELRDLFTLASNATLPVAKRIAIVEAMPDFVNALSNDLRKSIEPVLSSGDAKLVEAGQVFLVILGDKKAKKDLLKPYDNVVDGNPRWSQAFARRAEIQRRIHEYDDAIKDYMMALKNGENEPAPQPDTYIGLARCHAKRGRLKEASDWLRRAPIQITQLKALANDPDFAKVKEHSKYGEVFKFN